MAVIRILEVRTILARDENGEAIFTITTFQFSENDLNKEVPVSLYGTIRGDNYMGSYKTATDAIQEIYKRDYVILEEQVTKSS